MTSPHPEIKTYHCHCTHLLLASTHTLTSLPQRSSPSLDKALILPLPPPPTSSSRTSSPSNSDSEPDELMEDAGGGVEAEGSENETETPSQHESKRRKKNFKGHGKADRGTKTERGAGRGDKAVRNDEGGSRKYLGYSLILAMVLDKRPVMVRREDGFEKRVLWRCGRCRLVVGYLLDEVHYHTTSTTREEGDGGVGGEGRIKVVYLLPGGLVSTEEMRAGKGVGEKELMLGGG